MGKIKKINDEFYIEFEARGLTYQQKAGKDEQKAQMMLNEVEEKIRRGEMGAIERQVDLDIFFQDFFEAVESEHTVLTVRRFRDLLKNFQIFLHQYQPRAKKVSQMTPRVMEDYKSFLLRDKGKPGFFIKGVNFIFFLISEVWNFAIKRGALNDNPTIHVRLNQPGRGVAPRFLTTRDLEGLLAKSGENQRLLVKLLTETGLRFEELKFLQGDQFNQETSKLVIDGRITADLYSHREIPISRELLVECKPIERIKKAAVALKKEMGRQGMPQSIFRNTFGRNLIYKGVTISRLYRYLGLSDIAKIVYYMHYLLEYRQAQEIHFES